MEQEAYIEIEVPANIDQADETLGTKPKFWYRDAERNLHLFKRGRKGEDWSEKVAAELAAALGLPAAQVELANYRDRLGISSPNFLLSGDQMFHGNELMLQLHRNYPVFKNYGVEDHTVASVLEALESEEVLCWGEPLWDNYQAADQFVGYLLLDAWIGNTDRHHENWAVVRRGQTFLLAPSYDHASSLGRNEPEEKVVRRLESKDQRFAVEGYVKKARSAFYPPQKGERVISVVQAFAEAMQLRPQAAKHWMSQLEKISPDFERWVLSKLPESRISRPHREFAARILSCNRLRLSQLR